MRTNNNLSLETLGLLMVVGFVFLTLFAFLPSELVVPLLVVALVGFLYLGLAVGLSRYQHVTPDWMNAAPLWMIIAIPVTLGIGFLFYFWAEVTLSAALFLMAMLFIFLYFWLVVPFALIQKNKQNSWERSQEVESWPGVSLLVPAYKERGHISMTLDSIAQLTYPGEIELIVIDDGSLDGTYEEARDHETTDAIVITKENGGKHSALNAGLEEASYEFIIAIDADSWLAPDAVTAVIEGFERHPDAGAIAGNVKVGNRGSFITNLQALEYIVGINTFRRAFDHVGLVNVVPGCLGAFRKDALAAVEGYSADTLTEDFDLTIELLRRGYPVHASEGIVYTYAPTKWRGLYRQRLRWFRGNLQTLLKHKDVIVRGEYGLLAKLVLPYAILSMSLIPLLGIAALAIIPFAIQAGQGMVLLYLAIFFLVLFGLLALLAIEIEGEKRRLVFYSPFSVVGFKQFLDVTLLKAVFDVLTRRKMGWTSAGRIEHLDSESLVYNPSGGSPKFQLYHTDGEWRWRLRSRNGRTIGRSTGVYASKEKAERTIDLFRKIARKPAELPLDQSTDAPQRQFVIDRDELGDWRWQLVHENSGSIAKSDRGYTTKWRANRALQTAQSRADQATVVVNDHGFESVDEEPLPSVDMTP